MRGEVTISIVVGGLWAALGLYWALASSRAKRSTGRRRLGPWVLAVAAFAVVRVFGIGTLAVHSVALHAIGLIILVAGLSLALWARIYLGRNWGMPMTEKAEPELVTTGPYRYVRHPIYSGLLLAMVGTGVAIDLSWVLGAVILGAYFVYSARVEERLMTAAFPSVYPQYRSRTKMLIPFVL